MRHKRPHKNIQRDVLTSNMDRHYQRWTHEELLEFCILYPEIDNEYELAAYFNRTRISIRSLKIKHHRLCELGADPSTLRFVYLMEMSPAALYTITEEFIKLPTVIDLSLKIK